MSELYIKEVEAHVKQLFHAYQESYLVYHNLSHTKKVVEHCGEIAAWYSLKEHDEIILYTAAWFHDTGHLFASASSHETESIVLLKIFLKDRDMPASDILDIEKCILSTRLPQQPTSLLEKILCDADLYHLGTEEFKITDTKVRREIELRNNTKIKNWKESSISFLESHEFFTDYCRQRLKEGKEKNILFLKQLSEEES
jgi:HD superfamily phosphodiesterase